MVFTDILTHKSVPKSNKIQNRNFNKITGIFETGSELKKNSDRNRNENWNFKPSHRHDGMAHMRQV